jgi:hypothetical protein
LVVPESGVFWNIADPVPEKGVGRDPLIVVPEND